MHNTLNPEGLLILINNCLNAPVYFNDVAYNLLIFQFFQHDNAPCATITRGGRIKPNIIVSIAILVLVLKQYWCDGINTLVSVSALYGQYIALISSKSRHTTFFTSCMHTFLLLFVITLLFLNKNSD